MNSLKPLAIIAVLGGIAYAVYTKIHGGNDTPPPGATGGWEAPSVQLPGEASPGGTPWTPPASAGNANPFGPPTASIGTPVQSPAAIAGQSLSPAGPATLGSPIATNVPPGGTGLNSSGGPSPVAGNSRSGTTPPVVADYGTNVPPGARAVGPDSGTAPPAGADTFAAAFEAARRQLDQGQLAEGLRQLSQWYDDPRTSSAEQEHLVALLDQVAGTVVYSTQHLLEPPYAVQPNDRLEEIAYRHNVPWQLLAKINGIEDPNSLRPGDTIKVVRGPFSAVISLDKRRLTLLLNGCYAGRFPIGLGRDNPLREGQYAIVDKHVNPTYQGLERAIEADDPSNPLGERWLGLGSQLGIHGTNDPNAIGPFGQTGMSGCVSLSPRDVEDVYDILSLGSRVMVRK